VKKELCFLKYQDQEEWVEHMNALVYRSSEEKLPYDFILRPACFEMKVFFFPRKFFIMSFNGCF